MTITSGTVKVKHRVSEYVKFEFMLKLIRLRTEKVQEDRV